MKKTLLFFNCFLWSILLAGQSYQWAQRLGNAKSDKVTSVKTDGMGNVYIAGYFSTSITLGTNNLTLNYVANTQSKEAFIAKLDSTGVCLWARAGGAYYDDRVLGMDVDSAGYAVITGTFWEGAGINFPPINVTGTVYGQHDQCFIVRYDPNGTPLWGTFVCGDKVTPSGGNYRDDQGLDVAIDKQGNIYTVGFMTTVTLYCGGNVVTATNPNLGQHKHCYWLTKMNANGVFEWARTFGNLPWDPTAGKYIERDIALAVDNAGGVYVAGGFDSTRTFGNTTLSSSGGYDGFVLKYDTSGNFAWVTQAASSKSVWCNGICSDKNGFIYVTGEHRDSLIMDTVLVKNYDKRDAFVFKIDAQTGKPVWGKRAGSNLGSERGNDVWADSQCNIYVTGDINEGAKFGDNITTPVNGLGVQTFLARMTPEGKWSWVTTGGGSGDEDRSNALAKGKGNQVYIGGYFRNSALHGGNQLNSAGSSDGFLARIHDSLLNRGAPFKLNAPTKTVLCFGDTAHLKVPQHSYFLIQPTSGVLFNADTSQLVFNPTTTTTYTLTGIGEGSCPESDTIVFTLSVGQQGFSLSPLTDTVLCAGESISLPIPPHDYFEVQPSGGTALNVGSTLLTFSPTATTAYTISGYSLGVCPQFDTLQVTIVVASQPNADFRVTPKVALKQNPTFYLVNQSTGAAFFKWYRANGQLFSVFENPSVSETEAGHYCYTLLVESPAGCVDSTSDCGDIVSDERVFFPNAFTPNGDGINDEFKPLLLNIELAGIMNFQFTVANRFGQVVYSSENPEFGWDGRIRGSAADVGVYFYHCRFSTPDGQAYALKGDVTLLR